MGDGIMSQLLAQVASRLRETALSTLRKFTDDDTAIPQLTSEAIRGIGRSSAKLQGCKTFASHGELLFVFTVDAGRQPSVYVLSPQTVGYNCPEARAKLLVECLKKLNGDTTWATWLAANPKWQCIGTLTFEPFGHGSAKLFTPHVTLNPQAQGKGIAVSLYGMFLNKGSVLITDGHTLDAQKLWDRIATKGFMSQWYSAAKMNWVAPKSRNAVRVLYAPSKMPEDKVLKLLRVSV